jgi:leucyl aminopeptidase
MSEIVNIKTQISKKALKYPVLFTGHSTKEIQALLQENGVSLFKWQEINASGSSSFETEQGLVGTLIFKEPKESKEFVPGQFNNNNYGFFRDNVSSFLKEIKYKDFSLVCSKTLDADAHLGLGVGTVMSAYNFKKENSFTVSLQAVNNDFETGLLRGHCVNDARYLVDTPPNLLKPNAFKDLLVEEFSKEKDFTVKVLDRKQIEKQGYNLILGVGQASDEGPYLVHVKYKNTKAKKTIGAVGKGITFDTGGLDLKPSQYMRWMKKDMGGSATLFGFAKSLKIMKPAVNFDMVFAIAENSVSSNAFRPGDILTAHNGLEVEIHNTDAEGRLALASGFNYLSSLKTKFDCCFDVATLTGAIKVGLGDRVGGLFTNSNKLGLSVFEASETSADPLWLMPLPRWTNTALKSPVADLVNAVDGYGGAITAAEFLRYFVPEETPWFHMDLFSWTDSSRDTFAHKGATGQGVQALQQWLSDYK